MREIVNEYGLTWADWFYAATLGGKHTQQAQAQPNGKLRQAWKDGEDPTEWCEHFEMPADVGDE